MGLINKFFSGDEEVKQKLDAMNSRLDSMDAKMKTMQKRISKLEKQGPVDNEEKEFFELELDQDEMRFSKTKEKGSGDYDLPILVSLFELGQKEYWNPREIEDNWKDKYLELNSGDLEKEQIEMAHGTVERYVYRNRHAWSLVNLQKQDLIEKNGHKKEYKITKKGIKELKEEGFLK